MEDISIENLDNFLTKMIDDFFSISEIKNCKIELIEDTPGHNARYAVKIKAIYNLKKEIEENIEDKNRIDLDVYLRFYKLIKTYRKEITLNKSLAASRTYLNKLKTELIDDFATSQEGYECINTDYKVIKETSKEFLEFTNKLQEIWEDCLSRLEK